MAQHLALRFERPERVSAESTLEVLKPSGRLVVGEILIDPDFIGLSKLREHAGRARFVFERKQGAWPAYLARFRPV